ncbi:MAG: PmoA family protein [Verrucomicrobia bacterium]|nr:PmoA family protein [Verrucomicrobiota bacterium]
MPSLPPSFLRPLIASLGLALLAAVPARAAAGFTAEKTSAGVTIKHDGQKFAEYVINEANKPYLFPVFGPTGKAMTRAYPMQRVEGEQFDHYHHRGVWFGHESINGINSWTERGTATNGQPDDKLNEKQQKALAKTLLHLGSIKHRAFREVSADASRAVIVSENDYLDTKGKKYLTEIRRLTFRVEAGARLIDWDQEFIATEGDAVFGDAKDAGVNIRVPSSMAVDSKKGGRLVLSNGATDAAAWGKRAPWADYSGPVEGETLGVALFNHPSSFRHPTSWHARTYGLLTANCFGTLDKADPNGPHTLKKGEKLVLRHRFYFHRGDEKTGQVAAAYERYAKEKK